MQLTVHMTDREVDAIKHAVEEGYYRSVSDAIRINFLLGWRQNHGGL